MKDFIQINDISLTDDTKRSFSVTLNQLTSSIVDAYLVYVVTITSW